MAAPKYAICIRNSGYEASLELRKLYQVVPDPALEKHDQIRVVDESGEDYVYPRSFFVEVELPRRIADRVAQSVS